jgi:cytochrome c-type biogenesis protein CcmE
MEYDPTVDADRFVFYMSDSDGVSNKVILQKPKPQDFERSEQIVLTGAMQNGAFVADEILMKCPSKYKEEEIALRK